MSQFVETASHGSARDVPTREIQSAAPGDGFVPWTAEDLEQSVAARFEQQVRIYPDRLAVKVGGESLTYDALNRAANRIAHALLAERGPAEEPITILIEHGVSVIAAILGVLKAGKIYVPLDPAHPRSRVSAIARDSEAPLLLTNHKNLAAAHEVVHDGCCVLNVDTLGRELSEENCGLDIAPGTLLNIMYTSGSTGTPKGVTQTQGNLLYEIYATSDFLRLTPHDRVALLVSTSFGASAATIGNALLTGAALLPFDLKRAGLPALGRWLIDEGITSYHSVPTVFRHLLRSLDAGERFPRMRHVQLGGEPVFKRDVELFRQHFPEDCTFRAGLGTTETYLATWYLVDKETELTSTVVPVGRVGVGKEILLLDEVRNPVAPGEIGEIAVKSRYLSPGYWKQPDQTAAVFLPPSDGGDHRIYLTGDLGRLLPDGSIEHLDRKDHQVKIRGHRVEVSEIETRLLDIDDVTDAAVVAKKDHFGENRLVAYVVPAEGATLESRSLRRVLATDLPEPMIPSLFVTLDHLPLLPFGKVDRNALPRPDWGRPVGEADYTVPRTPVEHALTRLWSEVLGIQQVSIHDSFLDLGGNSLLAAQIVARAGALCKVDLPLSVLFDAPTIAEMALVIVQNQATQVEDDDLARLVAELEQISDAEALSRLADGASGPLCAAEMPK